MDNYEARIGANIREVRLNLGYSQDRLAKMCDISNSTLSAYENSKKIPNLITIAKIAKELGVSIERLYYGDENISFINAISDDGRKIVNCIYVLWSLGVIQYYENIMQGISGMSLYSDEADRPGFFLDITRYPMSIKRLIKSLDEYQSKKSTFTDPEKYLELLLSSVATEINQEIEAGKEKERQSKESAEKRNDLTKKKVENTGRKAVVVN